LHAKVKNTIKDTEREKERKIDTQECAFENDATRTLTDVMRSFREFTNKKLSKVANLELLPIGFFHFCNMILLAIHKLT
jgi:hypothetical protein